MAYTVKQLLESKQFPDMRLVICKENLNQEIKGIRIIEIEDMVQKVNYYDILLKFCSERNIPVIEISEDEYY